MLPARLPPFTLPPIVAAVVARLPVAPPSMALAAALTLGLGRIVPRDAAGPLQGHRYALIVRDLGLAVHVEALDGRFRAATPPYAPDLCIAATLRDFIALGLREEDPDTLFFAGRLAVEGDTELGLTVKNLLDGIDWPGLVARALPPAFAGSLSRLPRG